MNTEFPVVAIGASAGGLEAVRTITEALPARCGAAFALTMHVGPHPSHLAEILGWHGRLAAGFARDGETFTPGRIHIAPSDRHMLVRAPGCIELDHGAKMHGTRPAIDPMFASLAALYGRRVVGVILSGGGNDGAAGLRLIRNHGGLALAQDPVEAPAPEMPEAAFAMDDPEMLPVAEIARRVAQFCGAVSA
jgi:two-component system chemotaxis response regulator CheB